MRHLQPEFIDTNAMLNATTLDRELLKSHIANYIGKHAPQTDKKFKPMMAESLVDFIIDWVYKFNLGQMEHKDKDFLEEESEKEVRAEYLDMFSYMELVKWKRKIAQQTSS